MLVWSLTKRKDWSFQPTRESTTLRKKFWLVVFSPNHTAACMYWMTRVLDCPASWLGVHRQFYGCELCYVQRCDTVTRELENVVECNITRTCMCTRIVRWLPHLHIVVLSVCDSEYQGIVIMSIWVLWKFSKFLREMLHKYTQMCLAHDVVGWV